MQRRSSSSWQAWVCAAVSFAEGRRRVSDPHTTDGGCAVEGRSIELIRIWLFWKVGQRSVWHACLQLHLQSSH